MNLPDLRVFTVVARHDSLHAAAEELHLTPSAISKALKRLEEELGLPLFDRSTRQLVLNERGALLLDRARTLLDLEEQARIDLQGERAEMDCRIGGPAVLWATLEGAFLLPLLPGVLAPSPLGERAAYREGQISVAGRCGTPAERTLRSRTT